LLSNPSKNQWVQKAILNDVISHTQANQILQLAIERGDHPRLDEALTQLSMSREEFFFWLNTLTSVTKPRDRKLTLIAAAALGNAKASA
jgi:hypothetical protein